MSTVSIFYMLQFSPRTDSPAHCLQVWTSRLLRLRAWRGGGRSSWRTSGEVKHSVSHQCLWCVTLVQRAGIDFIWHQIRRFFLIFHHISVLSAKCMKIWTSGQKWAWYDNGEAWTSRYRIWSGWQKPGVFTPPPRCGSVREVWTQSETSCLRSSPAWTWTEPIAANVLSTL